MTEKQENCDDCHLLHLSNVSLNTADIVSIWWDMNQKFSKKIVTRIRTRFEVFILESESSCYMEDIKALAKATGKST